MEKFKNIIRDMLETDNICDVVSYDIEECTKFLLDNCIMKQPDFKPGDTVFAKWGGKIREGKVFVSGYLFDENIQNHYNT